ncbi:MAG: metallophosphoesterase family protein [Candidatus Kapaibacterium sp.]
MAKTLKTKRGAKGATSKAAKKSASAAKTKIIPARPVAGAMQIHRFAHPFFTTVPQNRRKAVQGIGTSMAAFAATKLLPIPAPLRDPTMTLADVIGQSGANAIQASKSITFHAVGDTGTLGTAIQQFVSDAMSTEYDIAHPETSPAFFMHLGDVIYYDNTDKGYQEQFYVPYKKYPGKIIAIPGNHDGELFKFDGTSTGQKTTLAAFMKNFCQPAPSVPSGAGTIYRQMVSQPGVYWMLDAPYVHIIGLYSNVGESLGFISGKQIGTKQKDWLIQTLKAIKAERAQGQRKALVIATHHPPYSAGGHSSSSQMLKDIDDACKQGGIMPDLVLAAHAHNYQRYTRFVSFGGKNLQIPYIVAGSGGRTSQAVKAADGKRVGDESFESSLFGYGFLTITATGSDLTIHFTQVNKDTGASTPFDHLTVNLS